MFQIDPFSIESSDSDSVLDSDIGRALFAQKADFDVEDCRFLLKLGSPLKSSKIRQHCLIKRNFFHEIQSFPDINQYLGPDSAKSMLQILIFLSGLSL